MKRFALSMLLIALLLGGCSWAPRAGPSTSEVLEQGQPGGLILFDVVQVDDRVVSTLLSQPKESFARRFNAAAQPPELKIAAGDTVSVTIWESAAGGLFTEPLPTFVPGARPQTEPLAPESQPPGGNRRDEFSPGGGPERPPQRDDPPPGLPSAQLPGEVPGGTPGGNATVIPTQQVGADGAISVPYAGRVPAAGQSAEQVQQTIEARLANKALQPQALVIVQKSAVNAVTVLLNETAGGGPGAPGATSSPAAAAVAAPAAVAVAAPAAAAAGAPPSAAAAAGAPPSAAAAPVGTRVPLSPGGDRLLQVIANAGGAQAPVHEVFVRLSRGAVTATIPLQQLVSDPGEDIYAEPGDVLTLIRLPQTFSVFGATGRNAEIPFDAQTINLAEALGKSQGLRDDLAKPEGVFLFRYEPNALVRALDEPIATGIPGGMSPIVYRFNLRDGKAYSLAQEFPVQDKDVIFVADAPAAQFYNFATALNQITGPVITGLLVCRSSSIRC
jgi:polysaccharide biosynthesis/export protein